MFVRYQGLHLTHARQDARPRKATTAKANIATTITLSTFDVEEEGAASLEVRLCTASGAAHGDGAVSKGAIVSLGLPMGRRLQKGNLSQATAR